ncbi:amino acid adenylation domain-containing protein [Actinoalloteichus hoggarensis]|uniref:Dimodular nonribosomal peptide synthase n=1 Tax=Actinoalloteichus hoggarensis TaxID=1470176 RepID=A0A221VZG9_9PSEU|nr:non-ribosomal peptide synthetase [Actinoalloteichus hoggarensis]ASO18904.1 Dimodular nonribosomal peptide synthase [Actinoalloteichus hoggarensis]MBB5920139.1 amino acid adenylation domain-containing protein [Actinoalloteichus hoggarensis]
MTDVIDPRPPVGAAGMGASSAVATNPAAAVHSFSAEETGPPPPAGPESADPGATQAPALPLTAAQHEVWLAQRLRQADPTYNTGGCLEIPGSLRRAAFVAALRTAVRETESLRLRFTESNGEVRQTVGDAAELDRAVGEWLIVRDLRGDPAPAASAVRWMHEDLAVPRDPLRDRLFGFAVFVLPDDRTLWYQRVHHLLLDGYSSALLLRRVAALYSAAASGATPPATPFGPLAVLLAEEAAYRESPAAVRDRRFWADRLAEAAESGGASAVASQCLGGDSTTGGAAETPSGGRASGALAAESTGARLLPSAVVSEPAATEPAAAATTVVDTAAAADSPPPDAVPSDAGPSDAGPITDGPTFAPVIPAEPAARSAASTGLDRVGSEAAADDVEPNLPTDRSGRTSPGLPTATAATSVSSALAALPVSGTRSRWRLSWSAEDAARLSASARRTGTGWSVFLLSALAGFLTPPNGPQEVTLGLAVKGRAGGLALSVPGMTADILPLRIPVSPWQTQAELVRQVAAEAREVVLHQRLPQRELRAMRDPGDRGPLYGATVNINRVGRPLRFGEHVASLHQFESGGRHAGLSIDVHDGPDGGIDIDLLGDRGVGAELGLDELGRGLAAYLTAFVALDSDRPIASIPRVSEDERERLLRWGTGCPPPPEQTLAELFAAQVAATPAAPALVFEDREWSYAELSARVNRLARLLVSQGVGPERVVGIALPRTPDSVVATLAVAVAGGAFLPIDGELPPDRIRTMLSDARPMLLITDQAGAVARQDDVDRSWTPLDQESAEVRAALAAISAEPLGDADRLAPTSPADAAYLIYTSGSTGLPKGVVVEHRGLAALATTRRTGWTLAPGDRLLRFASPGFDAAVWELLQAVTHGAALVCAPAHRLRPGPELTRLFADQRITHVVLSPSTVAALPPDGLAEVRTLVVGGEACPPDLVRQRAGTRVLINAYGPTEVTVCSAMSDPLATTDRPAVGRPVSGMRVLVLDASLRLVPPRTVGEVYLAGPGVARGYLNQPALTALRFLPDPFDPTGARMYRTGDLAWWDDEGRLHVTGRTDAQVKVRGVRVELGEIESVLLDHPEIAAAAVILRTDDPGDPRLFAYARPVEGTSPSSAAVREHCARTLPRHLVPWHCEFLTDLPRTPSGKVDRRALAGRIPPVEVVSARFVPPRGAGEERIAAVWRDVLGRSMVGSGDNFFDLGGHSLSMTRLHKALVELTGRDVSLADLYAHPTVAEQARLFADRSDSASARPAAWQEPGRGLPPSASTPIRPQPGAGPSASGSGASGPGAGFAGFLAVRPGEDVVAVGEEVPAVGRGPDANAGPTSGPDARPESDLAARPESDLAARRRRTIAARNSARTRRGAPHDG